MPVSAGIAVAAAYVALNYRAYDGFFEDDELHSAVDNPDFLDSSDQRVRWCSRVCAKLH